MSNHQLTLMVCDDCWRKLAANETESVALVRASHRSSFWCEHSIGEDWHAGHVEPLLIYVSRYP